MDIKDDSIEYLNNGTKSELKFIWKLINNDQEHVTQTIKLLTRVNVTLRGHGKNPFSYIVSLRFLNINLIFNKNNFSFF